MGLSPAYVQSLFAAPEWAAAFAGDPKGLEKKLVPVRIAPYKAPGLLASIVHIDIVGLDETTALDTLLPGINTKRAKPTNPPAIQAAGGARRQSPRLFQALRLKGSLVGGHPTCPGSSSPPTTQINGSCSGEL